jgi:hypothetical protein
MVSLVILVTHVTSTGNGTGIWNVLEYLQIFRGPGLYWGLKL